MKETQREYKETPLNTGKNCEKLPLSYIYVCLLYWEIWPKFPGLPYGSQIFHLKMNIVLLSALVWNLIYFNYRTVSVAFLHILSTVS